jgi:hypothetical protein
VGRVPPLTGKRRGDRAGWREIGMRV